MPSIQQLIANPDLKEYWALVYTPTQKRQRFPAPCVFLQDDKQTALANADVEKHLHPAVVCGPSKSSEGVLLYYLIQWLND